MLVYSFPQWGGAYSLVFASVGFALFYAACKMGLGIGFWFLGWWAIHASWLWWLNSSPYLAGYGSVLALCLAIPWALFACVWYGLSQSVYRRYPFHSYTKLWWIQSLCVATFWSVSEYARQYFLCGYPWATLSWGFGACDWTLPYLASLGILGASSWVVLQALVLARYLVQVCRARLCYKSLIKTSCSLFFMNLLLFVYSQLFNGVECERPEIRVGAVHSTWPVSLEVGSLEELDERWVQLAQLLWPWRSKLDLLVLPEVTIPYGFQEDLYGQGDSNGTRLYALCQGMNSNVVAGFEDDRYIGENRYENALFCLDAGAGLRYVYGKRILVPMGEYFPLSSWGKLGKKVRELAHEFGINDEMDRGRVSPLYKAPNIPSTLILSICYEETFYSQIAKYRREGGSWIVSASHDGWFPNSNLKQMHFWQARLLATSLGIPLVRSTHQGITALVDGRGRIINSFGENVNSFGLKLVSGILPLTSYKSLSLFLSDELFVFLSCFAQFLILLNSRLTKNRKIPE